MRKGFKRAVAMLGAGLFALPAFACGGKPETGEGTLDIYVHKAGYGVQWCYDLADAFAEQDWVKAKYPNLKVIVTDGDQDGYVKSKLEASNNNHFDLLFGFDSNYPKNNSLLEELTEGVYNQTGPGEAVTFKDKYLDSYLEMSRYIDTSGTAGADKYYVSAWASGMNGIFYNEDILEKLGFKVPNTTNELIAICNAIYENRTDGIKGDDAYEGYSFIQSQGLAYWTYLMPIWWAQYEGIDGYKNYWSGIADNVQGSKKIFEQKGRLHSLEVFEDLLAYDKHLDPKSMSPDYTYKIAQGLYLRGNGVFHVNGDWFENEMAEKKAEIKDKEGLDYSIKLMRTPIVSELAVKLGITDAELSAIVDYVDGTAATAPEFTSTLGLSSTLVIETVREARGVVQSIGAGHTSYVPSYAREKAIAQDFLLFMATDVAQDTYMKATGGSSLPFEYDVEAKNPTLYGQLTEMHKDRLAYLNSDTLNVYTLPTREAYPLAKIGGLNAFSIDDYQIVLSMQNPSKTALDIYNDTISHWNDQRWSTACSKAGVN